MNRRGVQALVLAAALLAAFVAWQRFRLPAPGTAPVAPAAVPADPLARGRPEVAAPARAEDRDLGLRAPAAGLVREVAMLQWQESCDAGDCRHALAWSEVPVDGALFRVQPPEANPPFPFTSERFGTAAGNEAPGTPWPVTRDMLPENLRASFRDHDGVLWSGDPAAPAAGDLRIRYRIVQDGGTR